MSLTLLPYPANNKSIEMMVNFIMSADFPLYIVGNCVCVRNTLQDSNAAIVNWCKCKSSYEYKYYTIICCELQYLIVSFVSNGFAQCFSLMSSISSFSHILIVIAHLQLQLGSVYTVLLMLLLLLFPSSSVWIFPLRLMHYFRLNSVSGMHVWQLPP